METLITLDTETTGFSPKSGDKIVEVAAVLYENGKQKDIFHHLIWPRRSVPERAANVHGLTTEKLRGKPVFSAIGKDLVAFLEQAENWAHNASFDTRFLVAELEEAGLILPRPILCSLKHARKVYPKGPHKLEDLAARTGWRWTGRGKHSAIEDCRALGHVLQHMPAPEPAPQKKTAKKEPQPVLTKTSLGLINCFNRGKSWSKEQDAVLTKDWMGGTKLEDLCHKNGRTPTAIIMRLEKLGFQTE